ncbi:MAG: hypothetical protein IT380_08670 [Myxococcales bacterium]|nr:hypothetical protein [Myxococcales bacterium]
MLFLTLLVLSQAGPKCVTVDGTRVCGYDCKDVGGRAACAQTPYGVCEVGVGPTLLCFDPPTWLTRVMSSIPKPSCIWRGATGACGYDCKGQGSAVGCAQTPRGTCIAEYDRVVCADPPAAVYGVYSAEAPRPVCKARDNMIACGYGCKNSGSVHLACAATPFGVCGEQGGKVTCFDPDEQVICAEDKATPMPKCAMEGPRIACGYDCKQGGGTVVCAQTPKGKCDASQAGAPVCFDPPVTGGSKQCLSVLGSR